MGNKGIFAGAEHLAVKSNLRDGIHAFTDQLIASSGFGMEVEIPRHQPVAEFITPQFAGVHADIGIGDQTAVVQIKFEITGHPGLQFPGFTICESDCRIPITVENHGTPGLHTWFYQMGSQPAPPRC